MKRRRGKPVRVESDPLDAIEKALAERVEARERSDRRLHHIQRVATVVALVSTAATAGAATSLTVQGTTGVALLDRALVDGDASEQQQPPIPFDVAPTSNSSDVLDVRFEEGQRYAAMAFVTKSKLTCSVLVKDEGDGRSRASAPSHSVDGCSDPKALAASVRRIPAYVSGVRHGTRQVVSGYAAPSVRRLILSGPNEPYAVRLTKPWSAHADSGPVRMFVAVSRAQPIDEAEPALPQIGFAEYAIRVQLADGRVVNAEPPVPPPPPGAMR